MAEFSKGQHRMEGRQSISAASTYYIPPCFHDVYLPDRKWPKIYVEKYTGAQTHEGLTPSPQKDKILTGVTIRSNLWNRFYSV